MVEKQLPVNLPQLLKTLQYEFVEHAYKLAGYSVTDAAKLLGMKRTTVSEILNKNRRLKRRQANDHITGQSRNRTGTTG